MIAESCAAVMDLRTDRLARYLAHLTAMGILKCRHPVHAAHQFMGALNELTLWPRMMGRESLPIPDDALIDEAVCMFLPHYRGSRSMELAHDDEG